MSRSVIVYVSLALFVLLGSLLLPHPGLQEDELLFAPPLFLPYKAAYSWKWFGFSVPVMLMSYVGALKTWLFAPVLLTFGVSVWTVRLPAVLIAAGGIGCYYAFARRAAGEFAAAVLVVTLATDPMFLLATCFDWGPVAVQHLLEATALCLVLRFERTRSLSWLGLAMFVTGLALWNKALFAWTLIAMATAALVLLPARIRPHITPKALCVAAICLAVGCAPLLVYNTESHLATLRDNVAYEPGGIIAKLPALRFTLDGSGMFGYLVPLPASHRTIFLALFLIAIAIPLPLFYSRTRRTALFCLITALLMWIQMAMTPNAGATVHHIILMWPWPQLYVALFLSSLTKWSIGRKTAVAIAALIVLTNLAVVSEYYSRLRDSGGTLAWTNATTALAKESALLPREQDIVVVDWGLLHRLTVARRSANHLIQGYAPLRQPISEATIAEWRSIVTGTPKLFVGFTEGNQMFAGTYTALEGLTKAIGYRKRVISTVAASSGQPMIELFRLEPIPAPDSE